MTTTISCTQNRLGIRNKEEVLGVYNKQTWNYQQGIVDGRTTKEFATRKRSLQQEVVNNKVANVFP